MKMEELNKAVTSFVKQSFPEALDEFEIVFKSKGVADFNSTQVQNLVNAIYYCYLQPSLYGCTNLYVLVSMFAEAFKENAYHSTLEKIWEGTDHKKNSIAVPTLETIVIRDLSTANYSINKKYNYGYGQIFTLGDLNKQLLEAKKKILFIFNDIYLKHELSFSFQMPSFAKGDEGVMPKL
jgi:hypothetical protein